MAVVRLYTCTFLLQGGQFIVFRNGRRRWPEKKLYEAMVVLRRHTVLSLRTIRKVTCSPIRAQKKQNKLFATSVNNAQMGNVSHKVKTKFEVHKNRVPEFSQCHLYTLQYFSLCSALFAFVAPLFTSHSMLMSVIARCTQVGASTRCQWCSTSPRANKKQLESMRVHVRTGIYYSLSKKFKYCNVFAFVCTSVFHAAASRNHVPVSGATSRNCVCTITRPHIVKHY